MWVCDEGLEELVDIFKANNIDGPELSRLDKETLAELGIGERRLMWFIAHDTVHRVTRQSHYERRRP